MPTGTVKWFNDAKGFGFITRRRVKTCSPISRRFARGFQIAAGKSGVSFEVKQGPKGKQAADIKPL